MTYAAQMAAERYPVGSKIIMMESHDPDRPVIAGTRGTVADITADGQLRVIWSSGRMSHVDMVRDRIDEV